MSEHDIVVYGASGFVGVLVAAYLAEHAPDGTRIALAGRSVARLDPVRTRLGRNWPLIVADAADPEALAALAVSTRVVLTTVGPYAKYGRELVRACAAAGTDYVDLTGEVLFAHDTAAELHDVARATGARIVHSCGFDSIPSDLGVHLLHERATKDGAGTLTDTTLVVTSLRGGLSGGTIDSMRHQLDTVRHDRSLRRVVADPYALSPDRDAEPDLGPQPDLVTRKAADVDPSLRGTLGPFVMAAYNSRVVRRSNALRDWAYGRSFRYSETMRVAGGSAVAAMGLKVGLGALVAGLSIKPTRWVLDKVLPKPGAGPDERTRREGRFTVDLFTTTTTGARYTARVRAQGDPGYAATAVMISEAALALLDAPRSDGGVLTPATGIGETLVSRLRTSGMTLEARAL